MDFLSFHANLQCTPPPPFSIALSIDLTPYSYCALHTIMISNLDLDVRLGRLLDTRFTRA